SRAAPARQRLEADDLAAIEVDQRLEEGHEFARLDAETNVLFELQPVGDLALQLLVEPGEAVPAVALGGIESDVTLAERAVLVLAAAKASKADRRGYLKLHSLDEKRCRHGC